MVETADNERTEADQSAGGGPDFADRLVDDLLPDDLEWRALVANHPYVSLTLAGLGGYLLGRSRGAAIVGALALFATDTLTRNVNSLLGEDVL
jgi:hypothetical protein